MACGLPDKDAVWFMTRRRLFIIGQAEPKIETCMNKEQKSLPLLNSYGNSYAKSHDGNCLGRGGGV